MADLKCPKCDNVDEVRYTEDVPTFWRVLELDGDVLKISGLQDKTADEGHDARLWCFACGHEWYVHYAIEFSVSS